MKISSALLVVLSCVLAQSLGEVARYDNYRIYGVTVNSHEDIKALQSLDGTSDGLIFIYMTSKLAEDSQIVVAPHKFADFEDYLKRNGMTCKVLAENLQQLIDMERRMMNLAKSRTQGFDFDNYHTLDEIHAWLKSLEEAHPDVVSVVSAGNSYEGRDLLGVKLSHGAGRPAIFVESGIHAREWITPAATVFIVNELLTSEDEAVKDLAENYDWYVFPSVNPDGYVYTHEKDRMWRKTRQPYGSCVGADANRNWDFHWNEVGASNQPCSDTYAGPKAFSEPEALAVSSYAEKLKDQVKLYVSFHSFSQLLIFPNGYTAQHVDNHEDLKEIGDVAAKALAKRYGTKYTVGDIYSTIYPAAGTSIDYTKGVLGIDLSYCYELRPQNVFQGGFTLPAKQIRPTSLETLDSLVALVNKAKELNYFGEN
uniref:Zinc carboxypeptidase A 1 n=1 Tax=Lutzomyia longipalpis TaxID=7200 RepID=A0A7G3AD57_LUTLO